MLWRTVRVGRTSEVFRQLVARYGLSALCSLISDTLTKTIIKCAKPAPGVTTNSESLHFTCVTHVFGIKCYLSVRYGPPLYLASRRGLLSASCRGRPFGFALRVAVGHSRLLLAILSNLGRLFASS